MLLENAPYIGRTASGSDGRKTHRLLDFPWEREPDCQPVREPPWHQGHWNGIRRGRLDEDKHAPEHLRGQGAHDHEGVMGRQVEHIRRHDRERGGFGRYRRRLPHSACQGIGMSLQDKGLKDVYLAKYRVEHDTRILDVTLNPIYAEGRIWAVHRRIISADREHFTRFGTLARDSEWVKLFLAPELGSGPGDRRRGRSPSKSPRAPWCRWR